MGGYGYKGWSMANAFSTHHAYYDVGYGIIFITCAEM